MKSEALVHVFLVSFPGQGHVNPLLRLGKRLAFKGLLVTLSTPTHFGKQMAKANNLTDRTIPVGDGFLRFESFQDGWDDDEPRRGDLEQYMHQLELVGKDEITTMIKKYAEQSRPVSCFITNPFIPWLFAPSTPYPYLRTAILGQFKKLDEPFCVLMDTFQELEPEIVEYMSNFCSIKTVGPLFKYPEVPNDTVRCDMMKADDTVRCDMMKADDCIEWLDSKPASSVIYISFGTVVYLKQEQVDEIAQALLTTGISFLWVMKPPPKESGLPVHVLPDGFLEKVGDIGKIVQWSPQEKVLTHPSVSCFVSHCGWNSTMEALSCGVPIVAFPQWGDQVTDAVYLVDVFKTGVRMCRGAAENRIIPKEEVEKCFVEATTGPKASKLKSNALKWKAAAEAAVADGGSSERNIQAFIDEVKRRCSSTVTHQLATDAAAMKLVGNYPSAEAGLV
ncbi:hypothetical protein V6N13_134525 [Hibiscus sabdariffa]|uniref:Glycosyltransferase n=1 Tax=Hibiscus sabdariffa TaxID=183260 RepID=A0ABR2R4G5_9ROSI